MEVVPAQITVRAECVFWGYNSKGKLSDIGKREVEDRTAPEEIPDHADYYTFVDTLSLQFELRGRNQEYGWEDISDTFYDEDRIFIRNESPRYFLAGATYFTKEEFLLHVADGTFGAHDLQEWNDEVYDGDQGIRGRSGHWYHYYDPHVILD